MTKAIKRCARCGCDHESVTFRALARPVRRGGDDANTLYTHWAECPTNGDPIMMLIKGGTMDAENEHKHDKDAPLREEDVTRGDKLDDTVQEGEDLPEGDDDE